MFFRKISGESEEESVTEEEVEEVLSDSGDDDSEAEETGTRSRSKKPKKRISYGPSAISDLFANTPTRKHTVRIDTKLLAEAESEDPRKRKADAAEALRKVVATVGKRGEAGEHVRCVVSVAMLTEGWDANNVTQVLGIRAFGSQLLCEQVVGRGLRRMDYSNFDEHGRFKPEYVDVYRVNRAERMDVVSRDTPHLVAFILPSRRKRRAPCHPTASTAETLLWQEVSYKRRQMELRRVWCAVRGPSRPSPTIVPGLEGWEGSVCPVPRLAPYFVATWWRPKEDGMAKLTNRAVDALKPRAKHYVAFDGDAKGFGVRIMPAGTKSYILEYRPQRASLTVGRAHRCVSPVFHAGAPGKEVAGDQRRRLSAPLGRRPTRRERSGRNCRSLVATRLLAQHPAIHCIS
jgi:hypothetical protein